MNQTLSHYYLLQIPDCILRSIITMKLLFLICLIQVNSIHSIPSEVTTFSTTSLPASAGTTGIYDYLVQIAFNLVEEKIPEYLVNIIYDQSPVTTRDIVTLYRLETIDRTTTLDFLWKLNISIETVFSVDSLDKFLTELKIDFKGFYNTVIINKLNVTGIPLRDLLTTLNIDTYNFSTGMAYGDPDPYEEFKKGNYTYETLVSALEKTNKTLDDLFEACRDMFVTQALTLDSKHIVSSLGKYGFGKRKALDLWRVLGLTMENVYAVSSLKNLLDEFEKKLNNVPNLGVRTAMNGITINKKVYDTWNSDDPIQPYAEFVSSKFRLKIIDEVDTELDNIILLRAAVLESQVEHTAYIAKGIATGNIKNCQFITLDRNVIVTINVTDAVNNASYIQIPKGNITDLVLGSPLVCNGRVYGLAREISGDEIVLDSFSGVTKIFLNGYLYSVAIIVYVYVYSW